MITKYILLVWIGGASNQTVAIEKFDTLLECNAARSAVYSVNQRNEGYHQCIPYTFAEVKSEVNC